MVNWEKEMNAAARRDDQLVQDQEGRPLEDLELPGAASATMPSALEGSLYEQAIAAASARRGVSPETIMAEDYEQLSYSTYPTPECLSPDELETIYLADPVSLPAWAKDRLRHIETCTPCRRLFASMHPDAESRERFNQALEQALAEKAVGATAANAADVLARLQLGATAAMDLFHISFPGQLMDSSATDQEENQGDEPELKATDKHERRIRSRNA
jgi:hypothetical protein